MLIANSESIAKSQSFAVLCHTIGTTPTSAVDKNLMRVTHNGDLGLQYR